MEKIKIERKTPLVESPIFVDGITRAGKFFLGKIVSGFDDVEYFQAVPALEHLSFLEKLGCVNEDVAIALLQTYVDEHAYYMRIGRNLNFRFDDLSSVSNSLDADRYLKRSSEKLNPDIGKEIKADGRRPFFVMHECLPNIQVFFKTFPKMSWINLVRHPVDIIHSWYARGWGHRFGEDPLSFLPSVKGSSCPIPWFANGWQRGYESMSEIDRIIKSIATLTAFGKEAYLSLDNKQKAQICTITYERVITNTIEELERIGVFLNTSVSQRMPAILSRERLPRILNTEERNKKIAGIKGIASKEMFDAMMRMASDYEKDPF